MTTTHSLPHDRARLLAAEQRDSARTRVRRVTLGVVMTSVAAAGVGAVALGSPAATPSPAPAATVLAPAAPVLAPAVSVPGQPSSGKASTVVVAATGQMQSALAATGGS